MDDYDFIDKGLVFCGKEPVFATASVLLILDSFFFLFGVFVTQDSKETKKESSISKEINRWAVFMSARFGNQDGGQCILLPRDCLLITAHRRNSPGSNPSSLSNCTSYRRAEVESGRQTGSRCPSGRQYNMMSSSSSGYMKRVMPDVTKTNGK